MVCGLISVRDNKKKRLPDLHPKAFFSVVEASLQMSNFLEDYEAILNATNLIE